SLLREGRPWEAIHEAAREVGADLIVMGTHGRKGFAHFLMGSVAEVVLRESQRPVLIVRGPAPLPNQEQRRADAEHGEQAKHSRREPAATA
ncbi:MAG TPA: universal stress protein, partial [Candidatus Nitrosotalea sp.]|nr:universal stress protein [Candidatus Nitrosotalea sp.]